MTSERIERRGKVEPLTPRFAKFMVEALSGILLDDLQAPSERRVDYSCLRGLLAVEVKSLEEDGSERLSNLTDSLKQGDDWPEFFGAWPIDSVLANLSDPDAARRKTTERIGRAIVNHLKKANKQLAAHAGTFPRRNVVRLVVLVNEDNQVYDPALTTHVIQKELTRMDGPEPKYESIDAVMYLTERHATRDGHDVVFPIIVITGSPVDDAPWKGDLLDLVGTKWAEWSGVRHIAGNPEAVKSFATVEHVPEQMARHDLWRLQYRRRPYMRSWSQEQLRDRWDECIVVSMLAFLKDSPAKPSQQDIARSMESFTHVTEEAAHRGIPVPEFRAEPSRLVEAGKRMNVPSAGLTWLADGALPGNPSNAGDDKRSA